MTVVLVAASLALSLGAGSSGARVPASAPRVVVARPGSPFAWLRLPPAPASAPAGLGVCRPHAVARVVARTSEIVVYREAGTGGGERLYGCVRSSGTVVELVGAGSPPFVGGYVSTVTEVSARGDYAGFVVLWYGVDTSGSGAYVVNVATGAWVVAAADDAKHLVLGPAGSAAWLVPGAVIVSDRAGERPLDQSRGIAGSSLALHGLTLFWRDAEGRRSASLHPDWDGRCIAPNSVTVLDSSASRVYYVYAGPAIGYYGCWRASGSMTAMLTGPPLRARYPDGPYGVGSAGDYYNGLAVTDRYGAIANDGWPDSVLGLYDLRTTQLVHTTSVHRLDTLAVGRCGAMAWTQANDAFPDDRVRSSLYVYADSRTRLLDQGLRTYVVDRRAPGNVTDDETLTIIGHTVGWVHNGRSREVAVC